MTIDSSPARPPADLYDHEDSDNVCYLCGDPRYERLVDVGHFGFDFTFQRCACGLIKQTPLPNEAFFEWFFNSELFLSAKRHAGGKIWGFYDYLKDEPSRLATSRLRYRKLRRWLDPLGPQLDILKIGPSTGTFLHVARQHGHRASGCDVSATFVAYAREQYGVEIRQGRFEKLDYRPASFDVILLFNVIENIPNQQEFLEAVFRALKPGGLFILNFVDMKNNILARLQKDRYFLFRPPICYAFDREVMDRALEKNGFEPVARFRDVRYMTIEKTTTLLGAHRLLRLARWLRLAELPFPIYAYPSRIVVARRGDRPAAVRSGADGGSSAQP